MTPDPASPSAATSTLLVAADGRDATHAAAEHFAHRIVEELGWSGLEESQLITTHIVRTPSPHAALVVVGPRAPELAALDVVGRLTAALPEAGFAVATGENLALGAGPSDLARGAEEALAEHRSRRAGRLVCFPGRTAIERLTTPAEVLESSCIEAVEGLVGLEVRPDAPLDLSGFARPQWRDGRCVLLVQQGRETLVPFEVRDQVPCCTRH